jgi:hypothetical protein
MGKDSHITLDNPAGFTGKETITSVKDSLNAGVTFSFVAQPTYSHDAKKAMMHVHLTCTSQQIVNAPGPDSGTLTVTYTTCCNATPVNVEVAYTDDPG